MSKLFVLMAFLVAVGVCFNSRSASMDEAICLKDNKDFTCKASCEDKTPFEACKKAREISNEGCFKENIQCNTVDQITRLKNGNYSCNAVSMGIIL